MLLDICVPAPVLGPGGTAANKADELSTPLDFSYLEKASCGEPPFLTMPDK